MNLPSDFKTAQAYGGNTKLPAGGYVCKILNARVENVFGSDKLAFAIDVAEGEYKGFYQRLFEQKKQADPSAKFPGKYDCFIARQDGSTNPWFKGSIVAVEKSNPGYDFAATNGNEKTLVGKLVGVVFGEEEFQGNNGNWYTSVKPVMFRSADSIRNGDFEIPEKKRREPKNGGGYMAMPGNTMQEVTDDELPF